MVTFSLVAIYLPIYYHTDNQLFESDRLLKRRQDRIEKRANLASIKIDGPGKRVMASRIEKVEAQLADVSQVLSALDAEFAPVGSSEIQQKLKLAISRLAQEMGVQLSSMSVRIASAESEMPVKTFVDPATGRPLLDIRAKAGFGRLLSFLEGLKSLPFRVSAMKVKILAPTDRSVEKVVEDASAELDIFLVLSM